MVQGGSGRRFDVRHLWKRLIGSAHIIRHKGTTFNKSVSELSAKSRWCLSGTPIQNKLDDIGALFAFIRVHPFHSLAMFRRFISTPFYESEERRAIAAKRLTVLIDSLCLRRTRDLLNLPKPKESICGVGFSDEEREKYEQSVKTMNRTLRVRPGKGVDGFGMFIIQLQLRILCNHGTFQHRLAWKRRAWLEEKEDAISSIGSTGELHCSVCKQVMPMSTSSNIYRTYLCPHVLCTECLQEHAPESLSGLSTAGCPICSRKAGRDQAAVPDDLYFQRGGYSSKMQKLVEDVKVNLGQTKR
jgi:SWI/SNF-related matrix-associated actin-dependent regulator of chromatin subfamily A3